MKKNANLKTDTVLESLMDMNRSKRASTYVLSGGKPSQFYFDIDNYYLGGEGDFLFEADLAQHRLNSFRTTVIPAIQDVALKHSIARLAFVEKRDDGPVGILTHMHLILSECDLEGCIVRPDRRLLSARVKGRPIIPGERILIVSDVATSGTTISRPASCLRELGAIVPASFVLYDRSEGARERLLNEHIVLEPFGTQEQIDLELKGLDRAQAH